MFSLTKLKGATGIISYAAVAVGYEIYSFGHEDCSPGGSQSHMVQQMDVHVFNTVSLCWRKLLPVTPGRGECPFEVHPLLLPAVLVGDIIYIWGGRDRDLMHYYNHLYAFDVDTHGWFKPKVSGTVPEGTWGYSACVLGNVMYIYGGYTQPTVHTKDIYTLDTTTMVWSLINTRSTPLTASCCHSATIIGTEMFIFGAIGNQDNIIGVFDTKTNCWLSQQVFWPTSAQLLPDACWGHAAFAYNGDLYIFGVSDLWKFNPETFSWRKVEPKEKSLGPMYSSMVGDRVILFGVYNTPEDLYNV